MKDQPPYIRLFESGLLQQRADALESRMRSCDLCPHRCHVDRMEGERGTCKTGAKPLVSAVQPHFGEERPLVGRGGSGTIFFTGCNLDCIFCQNYDISHLGRGEEVSYKELASMMLTLQDRGCHNINLVSPSHQVYAITRSLLTAIPEGLHLPIVYNSGGYDSVETLQLLENVVDIYMPDFKYMDPEAAGELSGAPDYPQVAVQALREMHRQVGDLVTDERGVAYGGLLVRHLVLPNDMARTEKVLDELVKISPRTYVNIMDQYRPEYRARECFDLRRRVTLDEYHHAINYARSKGLYRLD